MEAPEAVGTSGAAASPSGTAVGPSVARGSAQLGVVIPALNEDETLPRLLRDLSGIDLATEMLVVDGGSRDGTVQAARNGGAKVMRSRPGRARQMNAGARYLSTPWLLMLHADSRLDRVALNAIAEHVRRGQPEAACLGLRIDHPHFFYRLIEGGQRIRVRRTGLVYGDQGLLIPRDLFFAFGPYPDEPIMEDVILNRWLMQARKLRTLAADIVSSPRRYEREGRVRAWVRNATLISRFLSGAKPAELAHRYQPHDGGTRTAPPHAASPQAMVVVFAKAPRAGGVKTRLACSIGDAAATDLYRRMGRTVIDQLHGVNASVAVCYDPPDAADEMRAWLGDSPTHYWPQRSGDLGQRLAHACDRAFESADRVVAIGTDAPAVDEATIRRCLSALESADVVLGPATDGGYYLLGLRAPIPSLFQGIPWSTETVLRETERRARRAGARVTYLEVESDVDTIDDLTPEVTNRLGVAAP